MKSPLLIALALLTVASLAGALFELQQNHKLDAEMAALRAELASVKAASAADLAALEKLRSENKVFQDESAQLRGRLKTLREDVASTNAAPEPAETPAKSGKKGFAGLMKTLLGSPEMKEAMRSQQGRFLNPLYADLVKSLGLSPADSEKFLELLSSRQVEAMERGSRMFGGEEGGSAREVMDGLAKSNQEIEAMLGPEGYAQFQQYEKTLPDRMSMSQLRPQLESAGLALQDRQQTQLLQIMQEERQRMPLPGGMSGADASDPAAGMKLLMSEEAMAGALKSQEDLNARVRMRATSVLTPQQVTVLESFQKQQIDMQKMGMKMGREMLKSQSE